MATITNGRWWLIFAVVTAAIFRLTLVSILPYDSGPDERRRYDVMEKIYTTGRAPRYGIEGGSQYVVKPIFAYRISAWLSHAVPGNWPLFRKMRIGSVAVSLITIVLAYLAIRNLWPKRPELANVLAVVLAFYPQYAFLGAYLNADAYTVFVNTLVFYLLTLLHRRIAVTSGLAVGLGLTLGLIFLGRENGYAGFIMVLGYGIFLLRHAWRATIRAAALALAVFLLFPTVFYLHQYVVYGKAFIPVIVGSGVSWVPPGVTLSQAYEVVPVEWLDYGVNHLNWFSLVDWSGFFALLLVSSFALFGYMVVGLPSWWYSWYLLILVGGVIGLLRLLRCRQPSASPDAASRRWLIGSAAVAAAALFLVVVRHNFVVLFQPQGRYLFPLLVPVGALLLLGWDSLPFDRFVRRYLLMFVTGFFVAAGVATLSMLVFFYV